MRSPLPEEEGVNLCVLHILIPHGQTFDEVKGKYQGIGRNRHIGHQGFVQYARKEDAKRALRESDPLHMTRYAKRMFNPRPEEDKIDPRRLHILIPRGLKFGEVKEEFRKLGGNPHIEAIPSATGGHQGLAIYQNKEDERVLRESNPLYYARYATRRSHNLPGENKDLDLCRVHLIIPHGYTVKDGEKEYRKFGDAAAKIRSVHSSTQHHVFITYSTQEQAKEAVTRGNPIYRPKYARITPQAPQETVSCFPPSPRRERPE